MTTPAPSPTPEWTYNISLPHVDVSWATFWVAVVALVVAFIAAYYAKRAFKAAEDDLKISKENLQMAMRKPWLAVSFEVQAPSATSIMGCPRGDHCTYSSPVLRAMVRNSAEGQRRCDAFFIEVIVPVDALSLPEQARLTNERHYGFLKQSKVEEQTLFPGGGSASVVFTFQLNYPAMAGEFELQYRLKDDYNDYPREGYSKVAIQLPVRPQFAYISPRDKAEAEIERILSAGYADDTMWHDKYTHAFEYLDAGGFKTPEARLIAAREIATQSRG